eukprot:120705-Amphidinium_carterae.1
MHCIQAQAEFHCTMCDTDQHKTNFEVAVRSLTSGLVCKKCQESAGDKKWGWFTCRGCGLRLPRQAGGNTQGQIQHCQNCAHNKQRGTQACKKCGSKIDGRRGEVRRRCISCAA